MAVLSKPVAMALAALVTIAPSFASPLATKIERIKHLLARQTFEWTAFGDSYSSGVGAGEYTTNSYRCLRYDQAYPNLMNGDSRLPEGDHLFHNVVCSGSSSADVQAYQFYDEDTYGTPSAQYGDRPRFGSPSMGSLSVGGNDIDFPGIIFNCIIETNVPGGPPQRSCEDQRKVTWGLLNDPETVDKIDATIKKIVDKARQGPIGDGFKLYVTGFPQFFSTKTDECDTVTFARTANPNDDGKEHVRLTQALRDEFNDMSIQLNAVIEDAVAKNTDQGVKWIPIDGTMDGHRFCEPGVAEPDQHNTNLWIYHYPYNEPADDTVDGLLQDAYVRVLAASNITSALGVRGVDLASVYPTYSSLENAVYDALEVPGDPSQSGWQDFLWRSVGNRVKVFHPQTPLHESIRDLVLDAYVADLEASKPSQPEPEPENPKPAAPVSYSCDGSLLCGSTPNLVRDCDSAVNNLRRGGTYEYAASTDDVDNGNCSADPNSATACGVFLEGPADCKGQGDDLWYDYQEIRANGCNTCGYKSFIGEAGGDCKMRIDYVSTCNNGSIEYAYS